MHWSVCLAGSHALILASSVLAVNAVHYAIILQSSCWVMFHIFAFFLFLFPFICNLLFALVLAGSFSSCLLCFSFFPAICWAISFNSFGFVLWSCCLLFITFCCQDYVGSFLLFVLLLRLVVYGFSNCLLVCWFIFGFSLLWSSMKIAIAL